MGSNGSDGGALGSEGGGGGGALAIEAGGGGGGALASGCDAGTTGGRGSEGGGGGGATLGRAEGGGSSAPRWELGGGLDDEGLGRGTRELGGPNGFAAAPAGLGPSPS